MLLFTGGQSPEWFDHVGFYPQLHHVIQKFAAFFLEGADTNKMVNCLKCSTSFSKEVR